MGKDEACRAVYYRALKSIAMRSPPKTIKWQEKNISTSVLELSLQNNQSNKMVLCTTCWSLPLCKRCIMDSSHGIWKIHARNLKLPPGVSLTQTVDVAQVMHIILSLYYEENFQLPARISNPDNQMWTHILDCNCGLIFTTVKSIVLNSITMR